MNGTNPDCVPGDTVLVPASVSLAGVTIFGYVQAINKIRITVANIASTGAGFGIPAAA